MKKSYSPQDFRRALTTSTLEDQPALEGLAKADEHDEGVLLFSAAGCERWTPVPLELVLEVEHLGHARCKDHEHPLVRIHLKRAETPEGKMLAGLLDAHATALRTASAARTGFSQKGCDCSSPGDGPGNLRARRTISYEGCQRACGDEFQSCLEYCDPRDRGCLYGCKLGLSSCLRGCR